LNHVYVTFCLITFFRFLFKVSRASSKASKSSKKNTTLGEKAAEIRQRFAAASGNTLSVRIKLYKINRSGGLDCVVVAHRIWARATGLHSPPQQVDYVGVNVPLAPSGVPAGSLLCPRKHCCKARLPLRG
jgi:hypothetical protein